MKGIRKSPGGRELRKRYLIIAAAVLVGIIGAIALSHLLAELGRPDLALGVVIVFGLVEFLVVVWLFRDFFEPDEPTEADSEIVDSPFTDILVDIAERKAEKTDD